MPHLTDPLPLFVYGTLLPGEQNYARYLAGTTLAEVPARAAGELWWIEAEDYPYLCRGDAAVQGYLITLRPEKFATTIRRIDRLEDFDPNHPMTSLYLRCRVEVRTEAGRLQAWSYLWNRPERPGLRLVSGDFKSRFHPSEG